MNGLWQDVVYAFRQLRRGPLFSLVVIVSLGCAMGVNTSLFSAFNASMLRPWAVAEPDRVAAISFPGISTDEWRYWAEHTKAFTGLVAMRRYNSAWSAGRRLHFDLVSANHFQVLGIPMELGRPFVPEDDGLGAAGTAAVIAHRMWETHFASDPAVVGRSVALDGVSFTVVGVASRRFDGAWPGISRTDLWLPLAAYARFQPPDVAVRGIRRWSSVERVAASAAYFDVLRIPVVAGRPFEPADPAERVAIVNETFARRFWPGEDPLGKVLRWNDRAAREVVGVTRDAHLAGLESVEPLVFQPPEAETPKVFLVLGRARDVARAATSFAAQHDPDVHLEVATGAQWNERAMRLSLFGARVVGGIGVLALALATLGLFSVSAYVVQQRTREIGIRMALGARPADVLRTILGPASRTMFRGFVIGAMGAVAASLALQHWLFGFYGLSPFDAVTYVMVALVLMAAGVVASWVPARRAMSVDPMVALRYE